MRFHNHLFGRREQRIDVDEVPVPAFFRDLNLGQVIESLSYRIGERGEPARIGLVFMLVNSKASIEAQHGRQVWSPISC